MRNLIFSLFSAFLVFCFSSVGYPQVYLDPNAPIGERVADLMSYMSLEEKIGQMTQTERNSIDEDRQQITEWRIGSLLSGAGSSPSINSAESWANMYDDYQDYALQTPLGIPLIYGTDAVHGHNNVFGTVIFPHNIGLGCTRNADLIEECARITALEVSATGIDWTFSPCIAVPRDERWGRTYEGFGEAAELAELFAEASVLGYQTDSLGTPTSIAACAKHFIADGGTIGGIDRGDAQISEEELREIHLPGYIQAIQSGVSTVMISYSSWNGEYCHGNYYLITEVLKEELGFEGIVVSDWDGINILNSNYCEAVKMAINAGIDMVMVPYAYKDYINCMTDLVNNNEISMERIDDAVERILTVKFQLGLFEQPLTDMELLDTVGCEAHRNVARQAVRESLVLLKNDDVLPLKKTGTKIHVVGSKANNIGKQCGGWTITWQGLNYNSTTGTTILEALREVHGDENISFSNGVPVSSNADVIVVVIGENPYAEGAGDDPDLALDYTSVSLVVGCHNLEIPVVTILISGRPMILSPIIDSTDALIAAWLPGTEGLGITDVLFGDFNFTGKLSHSWPQSISQVPINIGELFINPLFPYGYGMTYENFGVQSQLKANTYFNFYPNPATDIINVENLQRIRAHISIYSMDGKIMKELEIKKSDFRITIDMKKAPKGLYIVKFKTENDISGQQILVKN